MDQPIIDVNALHVVSDGIEYLLTNLTKERIDEFRKDAKLLSDHFTQCLTNRSNICLAEQPQSTDSQSTSQLGQNKKTSGVKRAALPAPVKKKTPISDDVDAAPNDNTGQPLVKKARGNAKLTEDDQNLFDELLATLVMTEPMLHNPRLKSNKFAGMKAEKWKQICDKLQQDVPSADTSITKVKDRWGHIRDDYLKRLRLQKQGSGSGFLEMEEAPLDQLLSGLKDIYELKETSSNIAVPEKSSKEPSFVNVTANLASNRKMQEKNIEDGTLKIIEESSEKFLSAIENIKESFATKKEETQNQDKATKFCEFLVLQLKDLNEKNFRQAQIKILQIVSDLKDQE